MSDTDGWTGHREHNQLINQLPGCRILMDGLDTGSIIQDLEAAQGFIQKLTFTTQVEASYFY